MAVALGMGNLAAIMIDQYLRRQDILGRPRTAGTVGAVGTTAESAAVPVVLPVPGLEHETSTRRIG